MAENKSVPTGRERQEYKANSDSDIYSIAHNIKNSLSIISGLVELCLSRMGAKEPSKAQAESVLKEIDRCTNALNQFLSRRRRARRFKLSYLSEIVESIVLSMKPLFAQKGVSVSWRSKGSLPPLLCEVEAIESVLINLLKNSLEATERGNKVKIEIFSSPTEEVVVVGDNGCGIPEENLPRVFESGFSTRPNGAGAGLSFCRGVMDRHQGTISVESEEGVGTVVTLCFPLSSAPLRQKKAKGNSS